MACVGEIWKCAFEGDWIWCVHHHEGHGRSEEDDVCAGKVWEFFSFEPFLPEGYGVVGEPVVLDAVDIVLCEADVVVAEIWIFGGKLVLSVQAYESE